MTYYDDLTIGNILTINAPDSNYIEINGIMGMAGPILQISQSLMTKNDTIVYGSITSMTDPSKSSGGGCLILGHGWEAYWDDPRINLCDENYDTLYITAGSNYDGNGNYLGPILGNILLKDLTVRGSLTWGASNSLNSDQGGAIELGDSTGEGSPYIDFHKGRGVNEDFNVRLWNTGDCVLTFVTRAGTGVFVPSSGSSCSLGTENQDWYYVYARYLRYDVNCVEYDAYDDLALVKLWGEKNPTLPENYDATKLKPPANDPFSILKGVNQEGRVNDGFFDVGRTTSFAMGCAKALAKKQDEHDALLLKLLNEVESLRTEIISLKNA